MSVMPDFGYAEDNFLLEKHEAPRNWKLLTDIIYNKDKYGWLRNHITLRQIRHMQRAEREKRKNLLNKNKLMQQ